jgi:hypothetical protein
MPDMPSLKIKSYFNQVHLELRDLTGKEKTGNDEIPNCKTVPGRILSLQNKLYVNGMIRTSSL